MITPTLQSGPATRQRPGPGTEVQLHADETLQDDAMSVDEVPVKNHPGVFKRNGGSYTGRVRDRRGHHRRVTGTTIAEVKERMAAIRTDAARGEQNSRSSLTFQQYAESWIETYDGRTSRGIRPETVADYKRNLERHAYPFLGGMRLAEIEPHDIRALMAAIERTGVAPNTVRIAMAPVKALLASAVEDRVLRWNPASGVRLKTTRRLAGGEDVKALTEDELAALITATPERWRLLVEFLAQTGLRIGEAIALEWRDVDFGQRRVRVERRLYRGRLDEPKSRYGRRRVPLTADVTRRLWEQRKTAASAADCGLVFPGREGGYLDRNTMSQTWLKKSAAAAGVPWAGFHTLRHTCATLLFRHGLNAGQVQLWLGHHSPAFTLATYVHLLPSDLPEPPAVFDQLAGRGERDGYTMGTQPDETGRDTDTADGSQSLTHTQIRQA
jgi:integrase